MPAGQSNPYTPSGVPDPNAPTQQPGQPQQQAQAPAPSGPSAQNPTPAWLRQHARNSGWSEDFERYSDAELAAWLRSGNWDPNQRMFRSEKRDRDGNRIPGFVQKPSEAPEGWTAWGAQGQAVRVNEIPGQGQQGGGGDGGYGTGSPGAGWGRGYGSFSGSNVLADPGYQFTLQQGVNALENSAAAKGTLRTGGTLQDIVKYGQDLGSQQYQNVWNRDFQGWQTRYNADLQKWMTRENNITALLNAPPPAAPTPSG